MTGIAVFIGRPIYKVLGVLRIGRIGIVEVVIIVYLFSMQFILRSLHSNRSKREVERKKQLYFLSRVNNSSTYKPILFVILKISFTKEMKIFHHDVLA